MRYCSSFSRRPYPSLAYYTNSELRAIISAAPSEHRGALLLACFGMIRTSLLSQLPPECVDVRRQEVYIPADLERSARYCLLTFERLDCGGGSEPYTLWKLLEAYPFKPLPMCWSQYSKRLRGSVKVWIPDGLRRTGIINYFTLFGRSATEVATGCQSFEWCHVTPASPASAQGFFQLSPRDFDGPDRA